MQEIKQKLPTQIAIKPNGYENRKEFYSTSKTTNSQVFENNKSY